MHSFVPVSLVATATLFSAAQGINILKPADGDTVDATQGFDVVWTYDSSDFTNWEIELANPAPGKLVATDVTQAPISGTATSTFSYHVAAFTGVADGGNYHVVLDPRNGGTGAFPESGEFTIVNGGAGSTTTSPTLGTTTSSSGSDPTTSASATSTTTSISSTPPPSSQTSMASSTPSSTTTGTTTSRVTGILTSASVVPPISVSTGGNSTITTSSTSFSTFISGSVTSLVPQSTIVMTTVVPGGSAATSTSSGTKAPTSSPSLALAAGGSAVSQVGLVGSIVGAILGVFVL